MIGNNRLSAIITPDGGIVVPFINKTGAPSVKGTLLEASDTTDRGVQLMPLDEPDPMGIMFSDGIADGGEVLVVVAGVAEVLYSTAVTRGTFARVPITGDVSATIGQAIAEPLPSPPFASDKHFQEIGHPVETIASPGLAKTVIHFN